MGARTIDVWLEAETAFGYRTFYSSHLIAVRRIVAIRGPSSPILDSIAQTYTDQGRRVIRWHSVHAPASLTGVVVPARQTAWVAGELFSRLSPPGRINLDWITAGPASVPDARLTDLSFRLKKCLAASLTALEELETTSDTEDNRVLLDRWIAEYLGSPKSRPGRGRHYFGCPLTPEGPDVSFLDQRFAELDHTIHLCNNPRTALNQALRRFTEEALLRGYQAEIYHDALDPARIDHVVVPEIGLGMTSSRPPHLVAGGKTRTWPRPGHQAENPDAESWWQVYQQLYLRAWQILETIQAIQRQNLAEVPSELSRIVAACIA